MQTHSGQTFSDIVALAGLRPENFREVADATGLDPFALVPPGLDIVPPSASEIVQATTGALSGVGLANLESKLGQSLDLSAIAGQLGGLLPEQLSGYVGEALNLVGALNGGEADARTILSGLVGKVPGLRDYGGFATQIVDWLLDGGEI